MGSQKQNPEKKNAHENKAFLSQNYTILALQYESACICGGLCNPYPLQERASAVAPPPYVHPLLSAGTRHCSKFLSHVENKQISDLSRQNKIETKKPAVTGN